MPAFLEEADKLLTKYPKVNLLRARSQEIDGNGVVRHTENVTEEYLDNLRFMHRMYQDDWAGGVASFVYRTPVLKSKGMFVDFPSAWFSDDVTNIMMAAEGCCLTEKVEFRVRNSDVNISGQWGNPEDSRKKMIATYMNYKWMKKFMVQFEDETDKGFVETVTKEYRHKIYNNIQNYIYSCPFKDFMRFLWQCPSDLGLFKPRMLAHYLRNKLKI